MKINHMVEEEKFHMNEILFNVDGFDKMHVFGDIDKFINIDDIASWMKTTIIDVVGFSSKWLITFVSS
jgi:hypothetical protein